MNNAQPVIVANPNDALAWLNVHGFKADHTLRLDDGTTLEAVVTLPLHKDRGPDPVLCNRRRISFRRFSAEGFRL